MIAIRRMEGPRWLEGGHGRPVSSGIIRRPGKAGNPKPIPQPSHTTRLPEARISRGPNGEGFMFPWLHLYVYAAHKAAELERARRREEEEIMTGYTPEDLAGDWQFKIVKGTFKKRRQIEAVQEEQAEFGWTLVEIFDHNRIRFKRPASETAKDEFREGNPYATVSRSAGPGCGTAVVAGMAVLLGTYCWLA
jgi:hypothetical protein